MGYAVFLPQSPSMAFLISSRRARRRRRALISLLHHSPRHMLLVMKFGGTSVADIARIKNSALHVKREVDAGNRVAVVVSAMAGHTNQLVAWTREAHPLHDAREYDAVVSSGEQITAGLMAIILQSMGVSARSWQGWQIPLMTDDAHGVARIDRIETAEICSGVLNGARSRSSPVFRD